MDVEFFSWAPDLEAELVHGVDLVEIVHDEVEQRSSDGNRTVEFSGFVYLHFIDFGFHDLKNKGWREKTGEEEMDHKKKFVEA